MNRVFLWTTFMVAIFGFFLCSNHLIPNHHNNDFLSTDSSGFSNEAPSKELSECVDKNTYSYNGRTCVSEDISFNYDNSLFIKDFAIENLGSYFSSTVKVKSPQGSSIHILHNVLQV